MSERGRKDYVGDNIPPGLNRFSSGPGRAPANEVGILPDLHLSCGFDGVHYGTVRAEKKDAVPMALTLQREMSGIKGAICFASAETTFYSSVTLKIKNFGKANKNNPNPIA